MKKLDFSKETAKNLFFIILGTLITSLSINMFIINANLVSGGVTGISLIIQYLFKIPVGYSVFILNIPLLILSFFKINRRFTFMTIFGTVSSSITLLLTDFTKSFIPSEDPLILCIYGGVLSGLGLGIVFTNRGSTGGFDVFSALIKKQYPDAEIGKVSFILNTIIVILGALFFGLTKALYSLISMYISSFVIDRVIKGFNRKKLILIITEHEDDMSKAIMRDVKRGVTLLYGEGAYTHHQRKIIYCVVALSQVPTVREIAGYVDPKCFMSILDVSEVLGYGFRKDLNF
ncbi:MAG: YitT family protein [Clostridiaceae bacterium]